MVRKDQRGELRNPLVLDDCELVAPEFEAVDKELARVFDRFGYQSLTLFDWMSVLGEEYGELCKAVNDYEFGSEGQGDLKDIYAEAVQVAAVAVHLSAIVREAS